MGVPHRTAILRALTAALAAALVVVACGGGNGLRSDLDGARERWKAAAIEDYDMVLRYGCFCPPDVTGPFSVKVRAGAVAEVTFDGADIDPDRPGAPTELFTIEGIFDEIEANLDVDSIEVTYGDDGNPISVVADPIADAVDDEWSLSVELVVP